ncbi:MAG TPA: class I SAM-dependent methyltransferase [Chloroflexota bacterium]|jgi:SAM-dependent methyltransferase|nr:class I SAM-dependent methyltransferase [Chloroflexota bacterium]
MRLLRHDACPAAGGNEAWYRYHGARRARLLSVGDVAEGERRAMADLDFLERQIPLARSSHILEIGCAWGRHTTELLRRGYTSVVSVDIDPAMLARAHRRLADARLAPDLREASFMDITRAEGPFDAVLQLYDRSVLGFPTEDEDRASLHHVAGLLRPGGHLLFGIRDWPLDLPHAARSWQETAEGLELDEVVADPVTMTCTHRTTVLHPGGARETFELARRHYNLPEVRGLLRAAGFVLVAAWHAYDEARPYGSERQGMVVLARAGGCEG